MNFFNLIDGLFTEQKENETYSKSFRFDGDSIHIEHKISDPYNEYVKDGKLTEKGQDYISDILTDYLHSINEIVAVYKIECGIFVKFSFDERHFEYSYEHLDDGSTTFELVGEGNAVKNEDVVNLDGKIDESKINSSDKKVYENVPSEFNNNETSTEDLNKNKKYETTQSNELKWWEDDPYAGSKEPRKCFSDMLKERISMDKEEYESHCHVDPEVWISNIIEATENDDFVVKFDEDGNPIFIELDIDNLCDDFWKDEDDAEYLVENEREELDEFCEIVCADLGFKKAEYYVKSEYDDVFGKETHTIIFKLIF